MESLQGASSAGFAWPKAYFAVVCLWFVGVTAINCYCTYSYAIPFVVSLLVALGSITAGVAFMEVVGKTARVRRRLTRYVDMHGQSWWVEESPRCPIQAIPIAAPEQVAPAASSEARLILRKIRDVPSTPWAMMRWRSGPVSPKSDGAEGTGIRPNEDDRWCRAKSGRNRCRTNPKPLRLTLTRQA